MRENSPMPMRSDCKHYDSRTYATGEVVRKCRLDLAPEAPWRCPEDCAGYVQRRGDVGWQYGSLVAERAGGTEPEPKGSDVASLLDAAEDIVNAAAPDLLAEFDSLDRKGKWRRKVGKGKKKNKKK